jgi:hypothetical protein
MKQLRKGKLREWVIDAKPVIHHLRYCLYEAFVFQWFDNVAVGSEPVGLSYITLLLRGGEQHHGQVLGPALGA